MLRDFTKRLVRTCMALLLFNASPGFAAAGDLRLIEAIRSKDSAAIQSLVRARVDVNATQGDGATALHWAVHLDDFATVELLLRSGARVNVANDLGVTPLYLSCTNRNAAMIERLLKASANPNAALLNGETVLMNCARTGNPAAVKAVLKAGANVNAREPEHDQTALMWAAAQKHPEAVAALLEAGADFRARSRSYEQTVTSEVTQRAGREELNYTVVRGGSTPLLFAARSGDVESIRLLLTAGARVDDSLPDGMSALVLAAHSGNGPAASMLLEKGADANAAAIGYSALHAAVLRGDLKLVKDLLAHGGNVNSRITKGTPLRRNNQDYNLPATLVGATPYWLAAKFLEPDIMRELIAAGADPVLALPDGTTPVMAAVGAKDAADSDRRGLSALDGGKVPNEAQVLEIVNAVLSRPADLNAKGPSGDTAIHTAVSKGYDSVVRLLAERGAMLNIKNNTGRTPLALLIARRPPPQPSLVEFLRGMGAE